MAATRGRDDGSMFLLHRGVVSLKLLALLLVVVVLLPVPSNAYASWLKCFVGLEEDEIVMHHKIVAFEEADHKVKIEVSTNTEENAVWLKPNYFSYPETGGTVYARLVVPLALEYGPVQYVMETTEGGLFSSGVMCNGTRAYARGYEDAVTLEISGKEESVQIWAGWATSHEAVRLTEKVTLKRKGSDDPEL